MYSSYYLVLNYSSDLCAAYLDYSADLTQTLLNVAAPMELLSDNDSCLPLPLKS